MECTEAGLSVPSVLAARLTAETFGISFGRESVIKTPLSGEYETILLRERPPHQNPAPRDHQCQPPGCEAHPQDPQSRGSAIRRFLCLLITLLQALPNPELFDRVRVELKNGFTKQRMSLRHHECRGDSPAENLVPCFVRNTKGQSV